MSTCRVWLKDQPRASGWQSGLTNLPIDGHLRSDLHRLRTRLLVPRFYPIYPKLRTLRNKTDKRQHKEV